MIVLRQEELGFEKLRKNKFRWEDCWVGGFPKRIGGCPNPLDFGDVWLRILHVEVPSLAIFCCAKGAGFVLRQTNS